MPGGKKMMKNIDDFFIIINNKYLYRAFSWLPLKNHLAIASDVVDEIGQRVAKRSVPRNLV